MLKFITTNTVSTIWLNIFLLALLAFKSHIKFILLYMEKCIIDINLKKMFYQAKFRNTKLQPTIECTRMIVIEPERFREVANDSRRSVKRAYNHVANVTHHVLTTWLLRQSVS